MKIIKDNNYMDKVNIETSVEKYMAHLCFPDFFLSYLLDKPIEHQAQFRKTLLSHLSLQKPPYFNPDVIVSLLKNFQALKQDIELGSALVNKTLELLDFNAAPIPDERIEVDVKNFLRAFLFISYFILKALELTIGKEDAINYFKGMHSSFFQKMPVPKMEKVTDMVLSENESPHFKHAFNRTGFIMDEGHCGYRINKCRWAEVMKELNDPDLSYVISCHSDFQAAVMSNPAFELKREGTLIQGRSYCDFLWVDKRFYNDISKPMNNFWESIG